MHTLTFWKQRVFASGAALLCAVLVVCMCAAAGSSRAWAVGEDEAASSSYDQEVYDDESSYDDATSSESDDTNYDHETSSSDYETSSSESDEILTDEEFLEEFEYSSEYDDEYDNTDNGYGYSDGSTGRLSGNVSDLPANAKTATTMRSVGRTMGAKMARIAAGRRAMPGNNAIAKADFTSKVPEILQWNVLLGGCEIVSMTAVLNSMGYDVEPTTIADDYIVYDYAGDGDYVNYYIGSPYHSGGGFPPALTYAGNAYLKDKKSDWRFRDVTGADFDQLLNQIELGIPVLIWTTMYMEEPTFTEFDQGDYLWYDNEHCVVLYGVNRDEGTVSVMDPMEGLVDRDLEEFQRIFEECGNLAVLPAFG